jgi:hypothetical protein
VDETGPEAKSLASHNIPLAKGFFAEQNHDRGSQSEIR